MATKPKAKGSAQAPPKVPKKAKEKAQRERFIEAARAVGVDESGDEFERALARLVPSKTRH
jgi:hypothetical protein